MASYFFYIASASVALTASGAVTAPAHTLTSAAVVTRVASASVSAAAHAASAAAVANRSASADVSAAAHTASITADAGIGSDAAVTAAAHTAQGQAAAVRVVFDVDLVAAAHQTAITATNSGVDVRPIGFEWSLAPSRYLYELRKQPL